MVFSMLYVSKSHFIKLGNMCELCKYIPKTVVIYIQYIILDTFQTNNLKTYILKLNLV